MPSTTLFQKENRTWKKTTLTEEVNLKKFISQMSGSWPRRRNLNNYSPINQRIYRAAQLRIFARRPFLSRTGS